MQTKNIMFCPEKSVLSDKTQNIYIEGDNMDALIFLREKYKGKIKVIYIDPPYNTGKAFVYKDKFSVKDWSSMMYPRLKSAQELLSQDGVIFISIDDKEVCNLRAICNEIFGVENFITQFIYEKTQHFGRQKLNTYCNVEYILCYAKQLSDKKIKELLVERLTTEFEDAPLYNASNNITELIFPSGTVRFNIKDGIYEQTVSSQYKLLVPIEIKNGTNQNDLILKFKSRWSQKKIYDEIKRGTTFLIKSNNFAIRALYGKDKVSHIAPKQIIFTNKDNKHCTYSRFGIPVKTSEIATGELAKLLGDTYFSYPKPVSLISYLISLIYDYEHQDFAKDFTVLDFFSGSGTTAQAVMELNSYDNGNRKFILVQKPELFAKETKAYKRGYNNICELGEDRIKKFGAIMLKNNPNTSVDIGFKVYQIV